MLGTPDHDRNECCRRNSPLLVVGSVGLDSVETASDRRVEALGGAASYFSVAASFLSPVRLTAVVGTDFPEQHVAFLRSHNIDLAGLEQAEGRTFRWAGRYSADFAQRTTLDTQLNVFQTFRPKLPPQWQDSPSCSWPTSIPSCSWTCSSRWRGRASSPATP